MNRQRYKTITIKDKVSKTENSSSAFSLSEEAEELLSDEQATKKQVKTRKNAMVIFSLFILFIWLRDVFFILKK